MTMLTDLNTDCFQNVFSFLDVSSINAFSVINKDFYAKKNDFWNATCPQFHNALVKIDLNSEGAVRSFFIEKQFNEAITLELRHFFNSTTRGKFTLSVEGSHALVFQIKKPADVSALKSSKMIKVKPEFINKLRINPIDEKFNTYPTGANIPFFVITKEEFEKIKQLSAHFNLFLEKNGCNCKNNGKCDSFIEKIKKEMLLYFKETSPEASYSKIAKKIDGITVNNFNSQTQLNILSETFPAEIKEAYDRYVQFNHRIKTGVNYKLFFGLGKRATCIVS